MLLREICSHVKGTPGPKVLSFRVLKVAFLAFVHFNNKVA